MNTRHSHDMSLRVLCILPILLTPYRLEHQAFPFWRGRDVSLGSNLVGRVDLGVRNNQGCFVVVMQALALSSPAEAGEVKNQVI